MANNFKYFLLSSQYIIFMYCWHSSEMSGFLLYRHEIPCNLRHTFQLSDNFLSFSYPFDYESRFKWLFENIHSIDAFVPKTKSELNNRCNIWNTLLAYFFSSLILTHFEMAFDVFLALWHITSHFFFFVKRNQFSVFNLIWLDKQRRS